MFGWSDVPTAIWAFFVILPLVSLIHELGHYLFTRLFGGKIKFCLGRGKILFKLGGIEVRRVYFLDSWCQIDKLSVSNKWSHTIVYLGGPLFNIATVIVINSSIHMGLLEPHILFYQFVYFSLYFTFFSLLPVDYGDGNPSDGKAIYDVIKHGTARDPLQ
ncbi:site-2 protease family protein [Alteribacter keqinensis]|uniref:M50 family peptidase n=1 Tax=Alteribacter keqinensis TaxID=2483800 RepID=A0A3M7TN55_9BACI|nr:site-2 protease family protein [Alteribacter keqinensis]RNA67041.1 M50 family peptidase [Alteribacter keqinensis]